MKLRIFTQPGSFASSPHANADLITATFLQPGAAASRLHSRIHPGHCKVAAQRSAPNAHPIRVVEATRRTWGRWSGRETCARLDG